MNKKPSCNYDEEFKLRAVELSENSELPISKVASDLGIPDTTLHSWRKKYIKHKNCAFRKRELSSDEIEVKELKRELANVKEERDILKKALAIFSLPRT